MPAAASCRLVAPRAAPNSPRRAVVLERASRITSGDDYRGVVRRGSRFVGEHTVTYVRMNPKGGQPRFGFIVAKTVGNAVTRNLVRRRLKAICHDSVVQATHGADVVIRALPSAATAPFASLHAEVDRAFAKRGVIVEASDAHR
ncbi:ribonuclease P protein component [Plantibacter cousiniae (nom. nud.)]|uniref:ribonuclease P protein component n=1 Tax=Plantibacter cousiniae (nom. nud.) TaxID=199709 RepID=UPI003134486D